MDDGLDRRHRLPGTHDRRPHRGCRANRRVPAGAGNPYPAALDDCYAALQWAAGSAGPEHGFDDAWIGVLGESAAGGLAAALALVARDRGGPALTAQILDVPTVDNRLQTPSMRDLHDTPLWRAEYSPISWKYYLGEIQPGTPGCRCTQHRPART